MRPHDGLLSVLLLIAAVATPAALRPAPPTSPAPPGDGLPLDASFASDPLWDDGRAEVNVFDADEIRYGRPRPSRIVQILVKEDLIPGTWVKADDWRRPDLVPVLKLNWVLSIPTGVYSYEQMVSVFLRRSDLGLIRASFTHHEWCGNTWKALRIAPGEATLEYRTYWEGQAEGTRTVPWGNGTIASDALPALLRALPLGVRAEYQAAVGPSLIGSRVGEPAPSPARFRVEPGSVVPGGREAPPATRVEMALPSGTDRWWLETSFPFRVLRWERADGAVYRLAASRRLAYWRLNAPGDEKLLTGPPTFDPPLGAGRAESR